MTGLLILNSRLATIKTFREFFSEPKNNERVLLQVSVLYENEPCFISSVWMHACTSACMNVSSEHKGLTWTVHILQLFWVRLHILFRYEVLHPQLCL